MAQAPPRTGRPAPGAPAAQGPTAAPQRPAGYTLGSWKAKPNLGPGFAVTKRAGLYFGKRLGVPPGASGRVPQLRLGPAPPVDPLADLTAAERAQVGQFDTRTTAQQDQSRRITDAQAAQAAADAEAAKTRLGSLAAIAGQGTTLSADRQLSPESAALPGVLSQTAQRAALTENAMSLDTASKLPDLLRASAATDASNYAAQREQDRTDLLDGLRKMNAAQAQAAAENATTLRGQNLDYLGALAAVTGRSDVAALNANSGLARATTTANATRDAATIRAGGTTDAATIAAGSRLDVANVNQAGKPRPGAAQQKRLVAQWAAKAPGLLRGQIRQSGTHIDPNDRTKTVTDYAPYGGQPASQVYRQMLAAGLSPIQALGVLGGAVDGGFGAVRRAATGELDAQNDTAGVDLVGVFGDAYNALEKRVGAKRARQAFTKLTGVDPILLSDPKVAASYRSITRFGR